MKITFNKAITKSGYIYISLDGGSTYQKYSTDNLSDGIPLDDDQAYSNIVIKGDTSVISNLDVLKSITAGIDESNLVTYKYGTTERLPYDHYYAVVGKNIETLGGENSLNSITNPEIVEVLFEDGSKLKTIDKLAIYLCPKLRYIGLPDSVTSINTDAITLCNTEASFTDPLAIDLPSNLEYLGTCAFSDINYISFCAYRDQTYDNLKIESCYVGSCAFFSNKYHYPTVYLPARDKLVYATNNALLEKLPSNIAGYKSGFYKD